ncbi:MAG: hypothetical protein WB780_16340, partial [Candidatus Acidiferrales bacterium]
EQLLLHCDGELSGGDSGLAGSHLDACLSCRGRLRELTEGVDALLMFRGGVFPAAVPAPVHGWADLDEEFKRIDHPWKARFDFALEGFLGACRGLRYNMAAAVALLVLIFLIFQPWAATVSAAKLLARAIAAQSAALRATREPVVHQKLRIQVNSGAARTLTDYESWRDLRSGRFREMISSGIADTSADGIRSLRRIYEANHLDWQTPLSAEAYGRWSAGLAEGRASVARGHGDGSGGGSWLVLTTVATGEPRGDQIGKAEFFVRASDWHPVAMHFSLKDREYEISEAAFQVVPLGQVDSSLFDGSAAAGTEQVESAAPGDGRRNVHGGVGVGVGRARRSERRTNTAIAPAGKFPATTGAANQKQPEASHEPRPDAKSPAPAKSVRAETDAAGADTGMDLPLTLTYGVSTPLDQLTPGGGSRLNLGLPPAGMALNPGMAFAEQLARERAAMQQTVPQSPKPAAPGSKLPNHRRIGGHPIKSKTN